MNLGFPLSLTIAALLAVGAAGPARAQVPASAPAALRVVVFGDTRPRVHLEHHGDERVAPAIIRAVASERPALALHTGDYVERGSDPERWRRFAAAVAPLREAGVPLYPVLGNHEYFDRLYQPSRGALAGYFRAFTFPAKDALGRPLPTPRPDARPPAGPRWYSVYERGVLFLALDSNLDDDGAARVSLISLDEWDAQMRFVREHLEFADREPRVRHVVVVLHHPIYTRNNRHGSARTLWDFPLGTPAQRQERSLKRWLDGSHKLRAVLSGHNHNYERYVCERAGLGPVIYAVIGGGGAPATPVAQAPTGTRFGPTGTMANACARMTGDWRADARVPPSAAVYGYVRLAFTATEMRYELVPIAPGPPTPDRLRLVIPPGQRPHFAKE